MIDISTVVPPLFMDTKKFVGTTGGAPVGKESMEIIAVTVICYCVLPQGILQKQ